MAKYPKDNSNGIEDRYEIQIPETTSFGFDLDAFQELLNTYGIKFIHYTAVRCPIGLSDKFDSRQTHSDHSGCSNGFIYRRAGILSGFFSTNKNEAKLRDTGIVNDSSAIISFTRTYEDTNKEAYLGNYDRIYMLDDQTKVVNWQVVNHNQSGNDRLQFPAVDVEEDIIDANGNTYRYTVDFKIDPNGAIQWIPGAKSPGFDVQFNKGVVYSVRYLYQPFWYITSLLKEIRVSRSESYTSGPNKLIRLPYQVLVNREYLYQIAENDPEALYPNSLRQGQSAPDGSFGPK